MPYLPLAAEAGHTHVCAHRGHSIDAPENTLAAITAAADHGATVCEIDVVLSRDGEIVLMHDEILDRTTSGKGRVGAQTLAELKRLDAGAWFDARFAGARIPTLGEALQTTRARGLGLHVEIKERQRVDELIERLAQVLAEQSALDEVLVISFDHPSLQRVRARIQAARTEIITQARHVDFVAVARASGAASVAIEANMFHPDDARALHRAGFATRITIPRPDRIAQRLAYGLDPLAQVRIGLREGLIDILTGDDTRAVRELIASCK